MKPNFERPVALTCPDCGGALSAGRTNGLAQFRCHIGHVYSAEAMVAGQLLAMERFIEQALRSLNERADLCRQMSLEPGHTGGNVTQSDWIKATKEAFDRMGPLEEFLGFTWLLPAVTQTPTEGQSARETAL